MSWYALFVMTGQEEAVQKYIQLHYNINTIIPKRKVPEKKDGIWYSVSKKLFPGYILVNIKMDSEKYHIFKHIPKLYRVLGSDINYSCIDEDEISVILKLINDVGIIDYSKVYIENSIITFEEGPLKGLEGLVKKINKHTNRAKVQLNFMGSPRLLDVGIELLSKNGNCTSI